MKLPDSKESATTEEQDSWPELGFCSGGGGCVVVEFISGVIVVRDSKNPAQPGLVFSKREWADFRSRVRGDSRSRAVLQFAGSVLRSVAMVLGMAR